MQLLLDPPHRSSASATQIPCRRLDLDPAVVPAALTPIDVTLLLLRCAMVRTLVLDADPPLRPGQIGLTEMSRAVVNIDVGVGSGQTGPEDRQSQPGLSRRVTAHGCQVQSLSQAACTASVVLIGDTTQLVDRGEGFRALLMPQAGDAGQVICDDHQIVQAEGAEISREVEQGAGPRGDAKPAVCQHLFGTEVELAPAESPGVMTVRAQVGEMDPESGIFEVPVRCARRKGERQEPSGRGAAGHRARGGAQKRPHNVLFSDSRASSGVDAAGQTDELRAGEAPPVDAGCAGLGEGECSGGESWRQWRATWHMSRFARGGNLPRFSPHRPGRGNRDVSSTGSASSPGSCP